MLGDKLLPRSRTPSIASIASLGKVRRQAIYIIILAALAGCLFANLFFNYTSAGHKHASYNNFQHYLSERLRSHRLSSQVDDNLLAGSKPTIVALVSFSSRTRTEVLDCYLQQNLVQNGGLVDRVIFSPETTSEDEMNWLRGAVLKTDGYNLISTTIDSYEDPYNSLAHKTIPLPHVEEVGGSAGRSWKLAEALAKNMKSTLKSEQPEPLFLFINSETIYLSSTTIASMMDTRQNSPEYSVIQANVINQPVLSWLHSKMGVVKPYRPQIIYVDGQTEVLPPEPNDIRHTSSEDDSIFDELRDQLDNIDSKTKRSDPSPLPWRASELPTWTHSDPTSSTNIKNIATSPLLFGVPIDFQPPNSTYRWLPYDSRQSILDVGKDLDFRQRPSISSPIAQETFSLKGPGKWPWTLSAQQLYSFLEHLEEEADRDSSSNSSSSANQSIRGLSRYRLPLWTFSSSPALSPSLFLISSSDLLTLTPIFPFHIRATNEGGEDQDNEELALARWITSEETLNALGGRGAVVDGNAIAARFLPGNIGRSEWLDATGKEVRTGLEGTDLLDRFRGYGEEVGCLTRP